ncbi:DNA repair protein RAD5B-like isoform X2 [Apium graveolens]|uniref:DNA repair protein RAD5B-like isoform X2 n=1 Tax=Apium graveolens TaxID=4045 RepID=UPI003D790523
MFLLLEFPNLTSIHPDFSRCNGAGKTVMTISLILAGPGRGILKVNHTDTENLASKRTKYNEVPRKARGGTLIICPMALLGQWKDELITHSKPESISVSVYYGGEKGNDPEVIAEHDVFLTTYGVLTATYKNKVCDAFEVAGRNVMSTSNNVTTELVSHNWPCFPEL